jgi:hypothetical protein
MPLVLMRGGSRGYARDALFGARAQFFEEHFKKGEQVLDGRCRCASQRVIYSLSRNIKSCKVE